MTKHSAWLLWASVLWSCGSISESPVGEADAGAFMGGTATTATSQSNTSTTSAHASSANAATSATSSGTVTAASNAVTSNGTTSDAQTASGGTSGSSAGGSSGSAGEVGSSTQGGASGAGQGGGTTGTGNSSSSGGNAGRMPCESDTDCGVFNCCNGYCVNLGNDILNCGACGHACEGEAPFCSSGSCDDPPCFDGACGAGTSCCGSECCGAGKLCCAVNMGPSILGCFEPEFGTCPMGCGACACASPDTAIATPEGERSIAELAVGDLVYSVDDEQIRAVPIAALNRVPVLQHHVLQVGFADGSVFEMSGKHPTADGRTLSDLSVGKRLDGKTVTQLSWKAYRYSHTYDILPASSSGAYFASGVLVGSTMKGDGSCLNCGTANEP